MNLINIDIKLENEDQALNFFYSLLMSFDNFVNSILYSRDTISLTNVKSALNSKELSINLDVYGMNNRANDLVVKYSSNGRGSNDNMAVISMAALNLIKKILGVAVVANLVITKVSYRTLLSLLSTNIIG